MNTKCDHYESMIQMKNILILEEKNIFYKVESFLDALCTYTAVLWKVGPVCLRF